MEKSHIAFAPIRHPRLVSGILFFNLRDQIQEVSTGISRNLFSLKIIRPLPDTLCFWSHGFPFLCTIIGWVLLIGKLHRAKINVISDIERSLKDSLLYLQVRKLVNVVIKSSPFEFKAKFIGKFWWRKEIPVNLAKVKKLFNPYSTVERIRLLMDLHFGPNPVHLASIRAVLVSFGGFPFVQKVNQSLCVLVNGFR